MTAVVTPARGVEMFLMPVSIMKNDNLRTLSGNSLALFIAVTHRMYRMRSAQIRMSLRDLGRQLELGRSDIKTAARELREAGILYFQQTETLMSFQIQMPDGSKAVSYLRERQEKPVTDANIAL
jgi:biotin operon repressor